MENIKKPNLIEVSIINGVRYRYLNFDISFKDEMYVWEQIEIPSGKYNYGGITDCLIQHKYPIDKMQAVINNYLIEPENPEYITAFNEMQAWRKEAKEIAKEALTYGVS